MPSLPRKTRGRFELAGGVLVIRHLEDYLGHARSVAEFAGELGRWRVMLPNLEPDTDVVEATTGRSSVLMVSAHGHLECLDASSGKTRWIYTFESSSGAVDCDDFGRDEGTTGGADKQRPSADALMASVPVPAGFEARKALWTDLVVGATVDANTIADPEPGGPVLFSVRARLGYWSLAIGASILALVAAVIANRRPGRGRRLLAAWLAIGGCYANIVGGVVIGEIDDPARIAVIGGGLFGLVVAGASIFGLWRQGHRSSVVFVSFPVMLGLAVWVLLVHAVLSL